jgi:multidrug resistance efflux pump
LYLLQAITRPEWEAAVSRHRSLEAQISILRTELKTLADRSRKEEAQLKLSQEDLQRGRQAHDALLAELQQRVIQAGERVGAIEASFELGKILASRDGVVAWVYASPGEVVDHNDTLMTLVDVRDRWIEAYVEADDLSYVHAGQRAIINFKGLIGGSYEGRVVEYISRYANPSAAPRVGPDQVRSALRLGSVAHPVRIAIDEALPEEIR